jgi:tetratricopeptide (TPR) repeat protein
VSNETLFRHLIQVVPDNAKAHAILGHELMNRPSPADRERAIAAFRTALRIYPDYDHHDSTVVANLGSLLYELGRRAEALEVLEQAVGRDPEWGVLRYYLGLAYARDGQDGKAEAAFRRALALNPETPLFRSAWSRFLIERGRLEEGLAEADAALRGDPNFVWALFNRALALEALGRIDEAAEGYGRVSALASAPEAARQDAERRLHGLRSHAAPEGAPARSCMPGLAGC